MSAVRLRSGVIGVEREQCPALIEAVTALEYRVTTVSLEGIRNKETLLTRLSELLHFPPYFGKNWDALSDCLTDIDFEGAAGMLFVLDGSSDLGAAEPNSLAMLRQVLDDAADYHAVHGRVLAIAELMDGPSADESI